MKDGNTGLFLLICAVALFSFLLRFLPLAVLRKPPRSARLVAFLEYLPYTILSAMVIPDIFSAVEGAPAAVPATGLIVCILVALRFRSLPAVAFSGVLATWIAKTLSEVFFV